MESRTKTCGPIPGGLILTHSTCLILLDSAVQDMKQKLDKTKSRIKELEDKLGFLPEDKLAYFPLLDTCLESDKFNGHTYSICFFRSAKFLACAFGQTWLWVNTVLGSHFGVGEFTTHFRTNFIGWIGMFTGGTIWVLTHGDLFAEECAPVWGHTGQRLPGKLRRVERPAADRVQGRQELRQRAATIDGEVQATARARAEVFHFFMAFDHPAAVLYDRFVASCSSSVAGFL